MADISQVNSDLSNGVRAPVSNDPAVSFAASQPTSRPIDLIDQVRQNDSQISQYQYPLDLPTYYMTLDIQAYSRQDLFTIGQTTALATVVLPLPSQLVNGQQVHYQEKPVSNPLLGTLVNANYKTAQQVSSQVVNGDVKGGIKTAVGGIFSGNTAAAAEGGLENNALQSADRAIGGLGTVISAVSGYSPNYFLTVLLDGPQYKIHNFQWQFSPRTPEESKMLQQILLYINNAAAPGLTGGGAFFTFPRIFRISYFPNSQYLYKFKPAVLVNFTVDYSGGGVPAFYRKDSVTDNLNAPIMVTVSAQFLELEFWLRSDFIDNNDPTNTTGSSRGAG